MYYDYDQESDSPDTGVIHSGLSYFPTFRHILTLVIFAIFEAEGIYLCMPLNVNSNISFLIGQAILLAIIINSWYQILDTAPGPMSELFNEDILKKAIEQGLNLNKDKSKSFTNICTNCQIQKAAKTYHCEDCNRCVYKHYFHSKWLNTCIAKQNFPPFIAFLIFLDGYVILLAVDNLLYFNKIWDQEQYQFTNFFLANPENIIVTIFLFAFTFLILAVTCMIAITYYFAFRTRHLVSPMGCSEGCSGLKGKITSNDKILHKIRSTVRQSTIMRMKESKRKPQHGLFVETQTLNAFDLIFRALEKSSNNLGKDSTQKNQSNQTSSPEDTQKQLFSNLFAALLNVKKDQNEHQAYKQKDIVELFEPRNTQKVQNSAKLKWRRYINSTIQKNSNIKREKSLAEAVQIKNEESKTSSLGEFDKPSDSNRQFIMKKSSFSRRKFTPKNAQNAEQDKQNIINLRQNRYKFSKKSSILQQKLQEINEKESNLQDENQSKKQKKQKNQKNQNDEETMHTFSCNNQ